MKKILIITQILFLILIFNCNSKKGKGTYDVINIPAPSLRNNLVGTDTIQKIGIYLPPSYNSSKKSYPVVYFLLGYQTKVRESNAEIFNIMEDETVKEMIYVEISGYNLYKGSMYTNSPVTGNWEDYVTNDVITYVDKNYRTIPEKASRGLIGHSMGGLGAFNISLKHPDKFSAVELMSPAIGADDDFMKLLFPNDSTIISLKKLSNKMEGIHRNDYAKILTSEMNEIGDYWLIVACGVAFAPDTEQPLLMALPFNFNKDGTFEKNESVWELWRKGFGEFAQKVKQYKENLKLYTYYGMDVGYYDQLVVNVKAVKKLSFYMSEENIPHSVYLYNGDHWNRMDKNLEYRIMPEMSIYLQGE